MDALVTCIYNGLAGTPFGGRLNRDQSYRESLTTIAGTGLPIYGFVPAADLAAQREYFAAVAPNVELQPLELRDVPHHADIQRIKAADPERYGGLAWQERCVEIMWGKLFMLDRVLAAVPAADYVYWIDAGLANANIISTKYIALDDLKSYRLSAVAAAFPPHLFARIRTYIGDRLLILTTTEAHNTGIPERYNSRPYSAPGAVVAGLFGGPRARVAQLGQLFRDKVAAILADGALYFEESILTGIYADHPELFRAFAFDTWYHEGWASFDPQRSNFSNFFDLMLDTPPSQRVPFPWNS